MAKDAKKKRGEFGLGIDEDGFPEYVGHRLALWNKLKQEDEKKNQDNKEIKIMINNKEYVGQSFVTKPLDLLKQHFKDLLPTALCIELKDNDKYKESSIIWDLIRPLENDCEIKFLNFNDKKGEYTFWHSSAHILGEALELKYGCKLHVGPPSRDGGFYYDIYMEGDKKAIVQTDYKDLTKFVQKIVKKKQPFERLVLTKDQALEMFKFNKFKIETVHKKVKDGENCTAYRCGPLIDLCTGPHLPNTGLVKGIAITSASGAYYEADASKEQMQRVKGISFPDKKLLKEHQKFVEEAKKRQHDIIGTKQQLFFFHQLSPGSCFFLPHGARIYNKLVAFMRSKYRERGFTEVITPNIFKTELYAISGHLSHYKENMFLVRNENKTGEKPLQDKDIKMLNEVKEEKDFEHCLALKPMNCPGHCLMFQSNTKRSWRDLPIRYADFGVLHRNESSGSLHGLTRVRRFQQDDAHIFCTKDQIASEMQGCINFLEDIYGCLGFKFELALSTRPDDYMGELKVWDEAEANLEKILKESGHPYTLKEKDGAFYGPKIDIHLLDALKRKHQCATIQLDFQLPERFELQYNSGTDGYKRPVMIHRAIYGSLERFIAVLTEHTAGKWPFWLSPRQVCVVPVDLKFLDYAKKVKDLLFKEGMDVVVDESRLSFPKKIREARLFNYVCVVGAEEVKLQSVAIRKGMEQLPVTPLNEAIDYFKRLNVPGTQDKDIQLEKK